MRTRRFTINNQERENWIQNNEGLYLQWKRSRLSLRKFIKKNKEELDRIIQQVVRQDTKSSD